MTKSELIEILSQRQAHLKAEDVDLSVKALLEMMGGALANGERIEIRLGLNWTEYGIKPYSLGALESTGLGVPRQVSLRGNIPVEVRIGGRTFHVLSPVPVTT